MARTEEQKVLQSPVTVILGGVSYEIKPLPIKHALPWCREVYKTIVAGLISRASITTEQPHEFEAAMMDILVERPEKMVDLFFAYAQDLNKSEIMETATLGEIIDAFEVVKELEGRFFGWVIRSGASMIKVQ